MATSLYVYKKDSSGKYQKTRETQRVGYRERSDGQGYELAAGGKISTEKGALAEQKVLREQVQELGVQAALQQKAAFEANQAVRQQSQPVFSNEFGVTNTNSQLPQGTTGEVQPSPFQQPSTARNVVRGVQNVFTNPKEAYRTLRYPITASENSPPALRTAAAEDRARGLGSAGVLVAGAAAAAAPAATGLAAAAGFRTALRLVPYTVPITARVVAPRLAGGGIAAGAATGASFVAEGLVASKLLGAGTRKAEEVLRPNVSGLERSEVTRAVDVGIRAGAERQNKYFGTSAGDIVILGGTNRFEQEATFKYLVDRGVPVDVARREATTSLGYRRAISGVPELVFQLGTGKSSERIGSTLTAGTFQRLQTRGVTVANNIWSRGKYAIAPIAFAGAGEGAASVSAYQQARTGKTNYLDVAAGAALGASTAGLLGGAIAGAKTTAGRRTLEIPANVVDVFEFTGDQAARQAELSGLRKGRSYTYGYYRDLPGGKIGFGSAEVVPSLRPQGYVRTRVAALAPAASSSPVVGNTLNPVFSATSTPASSATTTQSSVFSSTSTPTFTSTPTPVGNPAFTPVASFTSTPATTPSTTPSTTPTATSTPATTPTAATTPATTPVTVVTGRGFIPPFVPPGGGLGAGRGFGGGKKRTPAGYAPSVAAVAFGISGKVSGKGGFSGLELRPIRSSPRASKIARFAA